MEIENVNQNTSEGTDVPNEFRIDGLIKEAYIKIAKWHNDDSTHAGLRHLSVELVEDIAGCFFKAFDIPYTSSIHVDEEVQSSVDPRAKQRNIDSMSEREIFEEIQRRKRERDVKDNH